MAKSTEQKGKMRDELKKATTPEAVVGSEEPLMPEPGETVISIAGDGIRELQKINEAPPEAAHSASEAAADKGDPVVSTSGETTMFPKDATLSKPEAELLARSFHGKKKEDTVPLSEAIDFAKSRNAKLKEMREKLSQQNSRVIADLRRTDPNGKKTCGRCGHRVPLLEMDSKKEFCEICAS